MAAGEDQHVNQQREGTLSNWKPASVAGCKRTTESGNPTPSEPPLGADLYGNRVLEPSIYPIGFETATTCFHFCAGSLRHGVCTFNNTKTPRGSCKHRCITLPKARRSATLEHAKQQMRGSGNPLFTIETNFENRSHPCFRRMISRIAKPRKASSTAVVHWAIVSCT